MHKSYVLYDIALGLKMVGFSEPCHAAYIASRNSESYHKALFFERGIQNASEIINVPGGINGINFYIPVPTYQEVFDWLLEHKNIFVEFDISDSIEDENVKLFRFKIINIKENDGGCKIIQASGHYNSILEAKEQALSRVLRIIN